MAINTFFNAGHTWTSSWGRKWRIDYVCSDAQLFQRAKRCNTDNNIDLTLGRVSDHEAVVVEFQDIPPS
eukprot:10149501-Karenia_brevis.AAC.1